MEGLISRRCCFFLLLVIFVSAWGLNRCEGSGTFGIDIHHRFSNRVKDIFGDDGLPDKDSLEYYRLMVHRDRLIRGRQLASNNDRTTVTFSSGNDTFRIGRLHYGNVTVGTPAKWFLVELDTGSDLFWLPCDCGTTCMRNLTTREGKSLDLNIYSPNVSSTSSKLPCNSTLCRRADQCPSALSDCPYQVRYLDGTLINGSLVEDILHLITEDGNSKPIDARVTLGCGRSLTGSLLPINGLLGLGLEDISVPSALAKAGLASDSFSMCFGSEGNGRISFGDKGSSDQRETPFNLMLFNPTYNITVSQISVGRTDIDAEFAAAFDTDTAVTWFIQPYYTLMTQAFDSLAKDSRHPPDPNIPFEFCYDLSPNQDTIKYPALVLTMKGGGLYRVYHPLSVFSLSDGYIYCLAVRKSDDINIIGQNFMTSYRVVFDRERMVLGWKESECYDDSNSSLPLSPPPPFGEPATPAFPDIPTPAPSLSLTPAPNLPATRSSSSPLSLSPFASTLLILLAFCTLF